MNILVCYKQLFCSEGISFNIGCFIIIPLIIFHIISIFIFYYKQNKQIKIKIQDIIYGIKNYSLLKTTKNSLAYIKRKKYIGLNNINKYYFENKKRENEEIKDNQKINGNNNPPLKKGIYIRAKPRNNGKNDRININIKNLVYNNIIHYNDNFKKVETQNIPDDEKGTKKGFIDIKLERKKIVLKVRKIMEYTDDEINQLPYELAIRHDKRSYLSYYCSLLKTKHNFIFAFFNNNDYNSKIIKIDLFFIGFVIYYTMNALFFDDDTMHNIYISKGSYDFLYQIPQIIYSSLISKVLTTLLRIFALSNNAIISFKQNKEKDNIEKRALDLNKKLRIIFILYYISGSIFLLFFWYYLSMFSAIYQNTQIHLIEDTLISFGLSLLYPFGIYLLPGIFRISSLSKKNVKCLYNISKIIQTI